MDIITVRKPRSLGRNMIIVCEDSVTAPNYLKNLRQEAITAGYWDYIEIVPKPKDNNDVEDEISSENSHKTPRTKRQFKHATEVELFEIKIENENKEQPVVYVRTIQKILEEGRIGNQYLYTEGWAVFDLDGHTGHERAALMAESNPVVKIAFSSRSIEMWFLLHFGQYRNIFQKVHCKMELEDRNGRKRIQNCNTNTPCLASNGDCLIGFIRRNTDLSNYDKGMDCFPVLRSLLRNAISNAEWLRSQYPSQQEYYLRNPYTTMDFLVRRLLNWISLGDTIEINHFQITVRQLQPSIILEMKNIGKSSQIVQKHHFAFEDSNVQFDFTGNGIFGVNESREITITLLSPIQNTKIKYPASNTEGFVWILC